MNSLVTLKEPWTSMKPGDGFAVRSRSGNAYRLVFVAPGERQAGIYVRFKDASRNLARFFPEKVDWSTLEPSETEPVLPARSEVLVTAGGIERRGTVVDSTQETLVIQSVKTGSPVAIPFRDVTDLKLVFRATDWRAGDSFVVTSRSGNEYRGIALHVSPDRVEAILQGDDHPVTLRTANLAMETFRVLIPVARETLSL
jgi:hypothetical protein